MQIFFTNNVVKGTDEDQDSFDIVVPQTSLLIELGVRKDDGSMDDWREGRETGGYEARDPNGAPLAALKPRIENNECTEQC